MEIGLECNVFQCLWFLDYRAMVFWILLHAVL